MKNKNFAFFNDFRAVSKMKLFKEVEEAEPTPIPLQHVLTAYAALLDVDF